MVGVNDPLAAKSWARKVAVEALRDSLVGKFMGSDREGNVREKDAGAMIVTCSEAKKEGGDSITVPLRAQLQGSGVLGHETLEGNEEAMVFRNDTVVLDELAHAIRFNDRITSQRVRFNLRIQGKDALRDWWSESLDQAFISQVSGDTLQTTGRFTGNNTITAPTYELYANASADATEVGADTGATLTLQRLSTMKRYAVNKRMRPVRVNGKSYFIGIFHDENIVQMRNASAAAGSFVDIQKYAMANGGEKLMDNPLFSGAEGVYDGVLIHSSDRLPQGIASGAYVANTRKGVICGAQAACMGYGKDNDQNNYTYKEESHDYGREMGCAMSSIFGMKKARFSLPDATSPVDFGVVVGVFYSAGITASF